MTAPIDSSLLPAEVRADGASGERLYESALGFESMLLSQLLSGLTETTGLGGGGEAGDGSGGDAGSSLLGALLPDALAQSVQAGGGAGLALQLYRSLKEQQG